MKHLDEETPVIRFLVIIINCILIYLQCKYLAYLISVSRSIEKKVLNTNYLANVATSGLEKLFPRSSLAYSIPMLGYHLSTCWLPLLLQHYGRSFHILSKNYHFTLVRVQFKIMEYQFVPIFKPKNPITGSN